MIRDDLAYTRQGIFENKGRWGRLILAVILLTIPMNGYVMRIYRGGDAAPEIDRWGRLLIDGLKLMVVAIVYSVPIIIVWLATYGSLFMAMLSGPAGRTAIAGWTPDMALVMLMYLVEFCVGIVLPVASIRLARSNRFSAAFDIRAVIDYIGKIGWINYVIGILVIAILVTVPVMVLVLIFVFLGILMAALTGFNGIAVLGIIAAAALFFLVLSPLFVVFQARYWTLLYDSAAPDN